jgi:dihydrofolate synthase/folylpolyglutamate synthase
MNYQQTLDYLFSKLPMFTRIGAAAFKKDLTNTLALCAVLNEPHTQFKSIHIAGTNGKGSTSHMLAAILQTAGYKTGLYTSPHLKDFRERIRINGKMISESEVITFVEKYRQQFESIEPSFFEWCVALCFYYFAKQHVDISVIETGLGGRLDSTNIINPQLCVITNIGWDHMDMLGDTLDKIAFEKAGIIKTSVPVVIGEQLDETSDVFIEQTKKCHAPLVFAQQQIALRNTHFENGILRTDIIENGKLWLSSLQCDLGGYYQQHNIITVLVAVRQLQKLGYQITDDHLYTALNSVKQLTSLQGRWQTLSTSPLIICDTGHNTNGIQYVLQQIDATPKKHLHMVIGMVKDKDIQKVLQLLPSYATYYFCRANIPRALPEQELAAAAHAAGLKGLAYPTVADALTAAQKNAHADDMIFIGGSTFVVAEAV